MSRPASRGVLTIGAVGFLLFVVGIVLVLVTGADLVVEYYASYRPASPDSTPWTVAVSAGQLTGAALAAGGVVLLAGVAGWLLCADSLRRSREEAA